MGEWDGIAEKYIGFAIVSEDKKYFHTVVVYVWTITILH